MRLKVGAYARAMELGNERDRPPRMAAATDVPAIDFVALFHNPTAAMPTQVPEKRYR
jgi:hypothetical protein